MFIFTNDKLRHGETEGLTPRQSSVQILAYKGAASPLQVPTLHKLLLLPHFPYAPPYIEGFSKLAGTVCLLVVSF